MTLSPEHVRTVDRTPGRSERPALRVGGFSIRVHRRSLLIGSVAAVLVVLLFLVALAQGGVVGPADMLRTLLGGGSSAERMIVFEFRMPRVVAAVLVGACLGVSGAQVQAVTGNPLGSPDLIGFTNGAATGAVVAILVFGSAGTAVSAGAVLAGLLTGVLMYLLAWQRSISPTRFVLIGVAVGAMLQSITAYLLIRADVYESQNAHIWLVGNLAGTTWSQVHLLAWSALVLLPVSAALIRPLDQVRFGAELATGLGVAVGRTRLLVLAVAIALAGVSVAAVGPIAFVALAAPQIARQLTRSPGAAVVPAMLTGAALLSAADLLARQLPVTSPLPVGVITGGLGGIYLVALIVSRARRIPGR